MDICSVCASFQFGGHQFWGAVSLGGRQLLGVVGETQLEKGLPARIPSLVSRLLSALPSSLCALIFCLGIARVCCCAYVLLRECAAACVCCCVCVLLQAAHLLCPCPCVCAKLPATMLSREHTTPTLSKVAHCGHTWQYRGGAERSGRASYGYAAVPSAPRCLEDHFPHRGASMSSALAATWISPSRHRSPRIKYKVYCVTH